MVAAPSWRPASASPLPTSGVLNRSRSERIATYPYVTNAFWYSLRNNYWQDNDPTDVEANYGLVRVDFTEKPAYAAFRAQAVGLPTDVQAPLVSAIAITNLRRTSATVTSTTDEGSSSTVTYARAGAPAASFSVPGLVTAHKVLLSGLLRRTTSTYSVESTDAAGNRAVSAARTFTTT